MNGFYTTDPEVIKIAKSAFPSYNGKTYQVHQFQGPMRLDSNWEGGSRSYYIIVNLATMQEASIPENGTPFSNGGKIMQMSVLPPNFAVVEHSLFCGKDHGIKIYVNPENLAKMLPMNSVELTQNEKIVLTVTASLKSFARFENANRETGINQTQYNLAKQSLISKGLLLKNGAVTPEGRNASNGMRLYNLGKAE